MPAGRPSKYDPAFCDQLIAKMAEGYSFEACCGYFKIAKDTGYVWLAEHPEFADAKRLGECQGQLFYEQIAKRGMFHDKDGEKLTVAVWIFIMKNRFGWRDAKEITGSGGGPLQISNLSHEEIDRKINELVSRLAPKY
jgi:hypothetical protein